MLDVTYQAMDQMVVTMGAAQGAANQSGEQAKADGKSEFDSMVEQKQQEAKGQQARKTETDTETDKAEPAVKDETVPDGQYAMVAAMLLQLQPNIQYTDPASDVEETVEQVLTVDPVSPELKLPVQDAVRDAAVRDVTVQAPEQTEEQVVEQTAEIPVEEAAAPVEIAPQQTHNELPRQEAEHSAPQEGPVREEGPARVEREDAPVAENVRWDAPVFGNVDAAPVKVAPPQEEPLELAAPDAVENLAGRIEVLLADEEIDSRVEFTLVPESLGKITVEITHGQDGSLHVLLSASTDRAAAMLERHTGGLQNLLMSGGRTQTQVEVRASEESQRQFFNPNGEHDQGRQQQQRQPRRQHHEHQTQDFVQQLRLGLIGRESGE